jgi:hypothetical protein
VKAPALKLAPKVALPLAILPVLKLAAGGPVPAIPPPPAAGFTEPIPPGGATVRVFEEKREEEAAPESSQAFARYVPGGYGLPLGVLVLLAAAGFSIGRDKRRPRRAAMARVSLQAPHPRPRRRT